VFKTGGAGSGMVVAENMADNGTDIVEAPAYALGTEMNTIWQKEISGVAAKTTLIPPENKMTGDCSAQVALMRLTELS